MTLYFFVNHVLRRYLRKKSQQTRKEIIYHVFENDDKLFQEPELFIRDDTDLANKLSRLVLNEANKNKTENLGFIYNELLYANKKISELVKKNIKLNFFNTRYLFQVSDVYFLEENIIILLDKLIKDPNNNFRLIKRVLTYSPFRDWVTLKSYVKNYSIHIKNETKEHQEREIYHIYVMELYQSGFISFIKNKPYISLPNNNYNPLDIIMDLFE